jgi:hypothetical protein
VTPRVLFLGKKREGNWSPYSSGTYDLSSGLKNSVSFVVQMLQANGIPSAFLQLEDNNKIDAAVTAFRPTHCILEAFWVVPEKLDVLLPLHPRVRWSCRNHSELAFLQHEGIAVQWIKGYAQRGLEIQSNSPRTVSDVKIMLEMWGLDPALSTFAPNWYPYPEFRHSHVRRWQQPGVAKIGLFGAVRPLKSHLCQCVAAQRFAKSLGRKLELHINSTRIEGFTGSDVPNPIMKNLRALFADSDATLVEHGWCEHAEFLDLLSTLDYSLQASFSETFNIVSCDAVAVGLPVVTSPQVPWMPLLTTADPNSSESICHTLLLAESMRHINTWRWVQYCGLREYCDASEQNWLARYA